MKLDKDLHLRLTNKQINRLQNVVAFKNDNGGAYTVQSYIRLCIENDPLYQNIQNLQKQESKKLEGPADE